jgi:hypothetical protein
LRKEEREGPIPLYFMAPFLCYGAPFNPPMIVHIHC